MSPNLILRSLLILAACIPMVPAAADILATDSFSYPDGLLYGNNGGTGWVSVWYGNGSGMNVAGGQAVSFSGPPMFGQRNFANPESAPGLFFGVDLTIPAFTLSDYFYVVGGLGANITQIAFGKATGSNQLQIGNGGLTSGGPELQPNSSLRLIGAYVKNGGASADLFMLWINPDGSDYFDVATNAHTADVFELNHAAFHSHHVGIWASLPGVGFDNLVISNSPGGVGLGSSAIPEPAGMLPLALLVPGVLRRRKRSL